jgi:hypothetical protein
LLIWQNEAATSVFACSSFGPGHLIHTRLLSMTLHLLGFRAHLL